MQVKDTAMAGTLESSDAQVTVEPGTNGIELSIESSVINQFGRKIRATVLETLERLEVKERSRDLPQIRMALTPCSLA